MKCERIIESNHNGFNHYNRCEKEAKFKAVYKSTQNGKDEEIYLCGVHARALRANCDRVLKKTKFNTFLNIESI